MSAADFEFRAIEPPINLRTDSAPWPGLPIGASTVPHRVIPMPPVALTLVKAGDWFPVEASEQQIKDTRLATHALRSQKLIAAALVCLNVLGVALCAVILIIQLMGKVAA